MINHSIDIPGIDDNRQYDYSENQSHIRGEYEYISSLIPSGSSVIDLGCGNGSLLKKLIDEKNVKGQGIEVSPTGVEACLKKGLKVLQGKIDEKLTFNDDSFDYAVCNVTIQMVMYPEILLKEMKRISKYQIISFPNFAFYKNRIDLLFNGRMPKPMLFHYEWYNTGHIHQFSIKDFYQLIKDTGELTVEKLLLTKTNSSIKNYLSKLIPNLFMAIPIFLLSKNDVKKN
jgi:methionine biosynthesis protein MetW